VELVIVVMSEPVTASTRVYGEIRLIHSDCQCIESWRGTNKKVLSGYYRHILVGKSENIDF
jgi:hypothetical protein